MVSTAFRSLYLWYSIALSTAAPSYPHNLTSWVSVTIATHNPPKPQLPAPSTPCLPSSWGLCASTSHPTFCLPTSYWSCGTQFIHHLPQKPFLTLSFCSLPPNRASLSPVLPKALKLTTPCFFIFHEITLRHYRKHEKVLVHSSVFSTGAMQRGQEIKH